MVIFYQWFLLGPLDTVISIVLLPIGSKDRGVLGAVSIPVARLPYCQYRKIIASQLHKHGYSWVVEIRKTSDCLLCVSCINMSLKILTHYDDKLCYCSIWFILICA